MRRCGALAAGVLNAMVFSTALIIFFCALTARFLLKVYSLLCVQSGQDYLKLYCFHDMRTDIDIKLV